MEICYIRDSNEVAVISTIHRRIFLHRYMLYGSDGGGGGGGWWVCVSVCTLASACLDSACILVTIEESCLWRCAVEAGELRDPRNELLGAYSSKWLLADNNEKATALDIRCRSAHTASSVLSVLDMHTWATPGSDSKRFLDPRPPGAPSAV